MDKKDEQESHEEEIDLSKAWSSIKTKLGFNKKKSAKKPTKSKEKEEPAEAELRDIIEFIKGNKKLMTYLLLASIIILGTWVRTISIPHYNRELPDLDSYLFVRYAEYLVNYGYLPEDDSLRYFPEGFKTFKEHQVSTYFIAGLYLIFHGLIVGSEVIDFAIVYPVISFAISMIFFFLMIKELSGKKLALIATAFLAFTPGYLSRTIAGLADKEAMAMIFWFSMIYLMIKAYKAKTMNKVIAYSAGSGILAGMSSLTWGGASFLFQSVAAATILITLMGKLTGKRMIIYLLWSAPLLIMSSTLSLRYGSLIDMLSNQLFTGVYAGLLVIALYKLVYEPLLKKHSPKSIPEPLWMVVCGLAISLPLIIILQLTGVYNFFGMVSSLIETVVHPFGTCPFCVSVSENQPPYFIDPTRSVDWWSRLQWLIPLFIIGSAIYVYKLIKNIGKDAYAVVVTYLVFVFFFIFSLFSSEKLR